MMIETKYSIGDIVFFISNGMLVQGKINGIGIAIREIPKTILINYVIGPAGHERPENQCWASPEDFVQASKR